MANPFPFTAGQVLTAAHMNGIGEAAVSFTPNFTFGYSRGNGTSVAYYMRVNKLIYVYLQETLGTTSSVTGAIQLTMPIAASRIQAIQVGRSRIDDTGAAFFLGVTIPDAAASTLLYAELVSGTYNTFTGISATVPMTWATTDKFTMSFVYEAA
jgi:hypothetical protein